VDLWPGWNLVGDPYAQSLKLGRLNIIDAAGHHHYYYQAGTALNDSVVRQRMWRYDDNTGNLTNDGTWAPLNATDTAAYLVPWQGYAVYAVQHCTIDFLPYGGKQAPPDITMQAAITWRLRIDGEAGSSADRGIEVGISPQASIGYDHLDAEKPPLVTSALTVTIPHPEWRQGPCSGYQYDYRPEAGYLEWPLAVTQNEAGREARLRFTESGRLPAGYRAYLVDRKLGSGTEIADGTVVTVTGSREFAVVCSDKALGDLHLKPLAFGMERLYPNPFGGTATISYQVPRAGKVSLKVYNVAGQLVRTLVNGEEAAGYYGVRWNGRNEGAQAAASGLYIVRLTYGAESRTEKLVKIR
jgi:hypothetical protein